LSDSLDNKESQDYPETQDHQDDKVTLDPLAKMVTTVWMESLV